MAPGSLPVPGDKVTAGQPIKGAFIGTTKDVTSLGGLSSGPHLHREIISGDAPLHPTNGLGIFSSDITFKANPDTFDINNPIFPYEHQGVTFAPGSHNPGKPVPISKPPVGFPPNYPQPEFPPFYESPSSQPNNGSGNSDQGNFFNWFQGSLSNPSPNGPTAPPEQQTNGGDGDLAVGFASYYPAEQSQQVQSVLLQTLPTGSYFLGSSGDASESTSADGTVELGSVATYATQPGYHQYDAPDGNAYAVPDYGAQDQNSSDLTIGSQDADASASAGPLMTGRSSAVEDAYGNYYSSQAAADAGQDAIQDANDEDIGVPAQLQALYQASVARDDASGLAGTSNAYGTSASYAPVATDDPVVYDDGGEGGGGGGEGGGGTGGWGSGGGSSGSPVVLDLTGKGIHLTQLSSSSMFFDMTGDGTQKLTAWAGAGC